MSDSIPLLDLEPEIEALRGDLLAAFEEVLQTRRFINGPGVQAFEAEVAAHLGVRHAVGLNSGTDALVVGLRALGIGPGDEVITSAFTFVATAEAVLLVGARPVFVDIDPASYNLDPALVEARITARTKALLPVHLYGQAVEMEPLLALCKHRGLKVLEDVAQAFGASYGGHRLGSLGQAGACSFFPSKILGAFGDAGMLVTDDEELALQARVLRAHGAERKYHNDQIGYNSRLDELQAALLRVKLPHVDGWIEGRRQAAARYDELLAGIDGATAPPRRPDCDHVFHQYTVRIPGGRRDHVRDGLTRVGVSSVVYYPVPLHKLEPYREGAGELPETERAASEVLSLPIWPTIDEQTQVRVAEALAGALGG